MFNFFEAKRSFERLFFFIYRAVVKLVPIIHITNHKTTQFSQKMNKIYKTLLQLKPCRLLCTLLYINFEKVKVLEQQDGMKFHKFQKDSFPHCEDLKFDDVLTRRPSWR